MATVSIETKGKMGTGMNIEQKARRYKAPVSIHHPWRHKPMATRKCACGKTAKEGSIYCKYCLGVDDLPKEQSA